MIFPTTFKYEQHFYKPLSLSRLSVFPLSVSLESEKYAFKLIFFWLYEWASMSVPSIPNPQPTPTISSTKISTYSKAKPHADQAPRSCHLPSLSSLLFSLICRSPIRSVPVKILLGHQANPIKSPRF